jgi:hypothetical protein
MSMPDSSDDSFPDPYLEKPKAKRIKPTVDQYDLQPTVSTAAVVGTILAKDSREFDFDAILVKDGTVVLNDGREFDFDAKNGSTLGRVFGDEARLVSAYGRPVRGVVVVPKSLLPGRFLDLPTEGGLFRRWEIMKS